MAVSGEEKIRGLIRLIPIARALKQDLDKAMGMEEYSGARNIAAKSYEGLRQAAVALMDDPYLNALELEVFPGATDKEKTAIVALMAGQLLAYLEGQTGVGAASGGGDYHFSVQSAPNVNAVNIKNVDSKIVARLLGGEVEGEDVEEDDDEKE